MKVKDKESAFEWDKGNLDKNQREHGVATQEAESVFVDPGAYVFPDVRHSEKEDRVVILGKSDQDRFLFVIFTLRDKKIRIISARRIHRKEVEKYEKIKQSTEV